MMPWWQAALWAGGIAAVLGGVALEAGLWVADPRSEIIAKDREDFDRRCFEQRGRVHQAISGGSVMSAGAYALFLSVLNWPLLQYDEVTNLTDTWGIPYIGFLAAGWLVVGWLHGRIETYWNRRLAADRFRWIY